MADPEALGISIIIPTPDEAPTLGTLIAALQREVDENSQ